MSTVESRLYLQDDPSVRSIMDIVARQRRAWDGYRITLNIHLLPGREESLPSEFPHPEIIDELRERLHSEATIETCIRTWVDPQSEDDQAAWVIVVRC